MSQNKICGVYKITHIGSGKSYIGISKNIHRRWVQHKSWVNTKNRRSAINAAMQKYGIDAFTWQIIEECDVDSLEARERHWISVFHSMEMLMPPFKEQEAIAEALTVMDDELEVLTEQVLKLRMVKEGMMQDLLTGKVRLA